MRKEELIFCPLGGSGDDIEMESFLMVEKITKNG